MAASNYFIQWTVPSPLPNIKTSTVAQALIEHVLQRCGKPYFICADKESPFELKLIKELVSYLTLTKLIALLLDPRIAVTLKRQREPS